MDFLFSFLLLTELFRLLKTETANFLLILVS